MKNLFILLLVAIANCSYGQSDLRKISISDLPGDLHEIKNISSAIRWTDSLGDNVVIITKKMLKREDEDRAIDKDRYNRNNGYTDNFPKQTIPSFAYHYQIINDSAILNWKVVGISRTCGEEGINHVKNWYVVTDLNKNFKAEVWLIYRGECINEDSGGNMKIVMNESGIEYTMNGHITSQFSIESNLDNNFLNGPEVFKKHVLRLWQEFLNK